MIAQRTLTHTDCCIPVCRRFTSALVIFQCVPFSNSNCIWWWQNYNIVDAWLVDISHRMPSLLIQYARCSFVDFQWHRLTVDFTYDVLIIYRCAAPAPVPASIWFPLHSHVVSNVKLIPAVLHTLTRLHGISIKIMPLLARSPALSSIKLQFVSSKTKRKTQRQTRKWENRKFIFGLRFACNSIDAWIEI